MNEKDKEREDFSDRKEYQGPVTWGASKGLGGHHSSKPLPSVSWLYISTCLYPDPDATAEGDRTREKRGRKITKSCPNDSFNWTKKMGL